MASTYTPISTTTLGSTQSQVTFSSIPSTYTDLILVIQAKSSISTGNNPTCYVNGDNSNTWWSYTFLGGDGTSAFSGAITNRTTGVLGLRNASLNNTDFSYNSITHFMNYSNTTTYKTVLTRSNDATLETEFGVNLWRSTSAITSITAQEASPAAFAAGTTLTLYGIKAA